MKLVYLQYVPWPREIVAFSWRSTWTRWTWFAFSWPFGQNEISFFLYRLAGSVRKTNNIKQIPCYSQKPKYTQKNKWNAKLSWSTKFISSCCCIFFFNTFWVLQRDGCFDWHFYASFLISFKLVVVYCCATVVRSVVSCFFIIYFYK